MNLYICRRFIEATFKETIVDLLNKYSYLPILNYIACINMTKDDNETIRNENNYFEDKLKYLGEKIQNTKDKTQKQLELLTEDKVEELVC